MNELGSVLLAVLSVLQMEFTLYDLTFSFWQLLLFLIVASAVIYLIVRWVSDQ